MKSCIFTMVAFNFAAVLGAAETNLSYLAGSLPKEELQAIYADDPHDAWNRIFHCLYTRTLKIRLSEDFPEAAPFATNRGEMGVSTRIFERIESGDRAMEPLYPHEQFRDDVSTAQLLVEPRFSEFQKALTDALAEKSPRPLLDRALMQYDAWAAYDFVAKDVSGWILKRAPIPLYHERQARLRELLAQFIKKIALTPTEIKSLPDNYTLAARFQPLPNLFATNSEWLEVLWLSGREHDRASHHRRAARVFVKPLTLPKDKEEFLRNARDLDFTRKLEAVVLVIQNLLVDSNGKVVPSPLTCEVQMRTFGGRGTRPPQSTRFAQYELSRRALLKNSNTGGLKNFSKVPAYLPAAGNDYSFAAPLASGDPTAVSLSSRCVACHGSERNQIFTFAMTPRSPSPPIRSLDTAQNEHGRWVAEFKMKQDSFKKLSAAWRSATGL